MSKPPKSHFTNPYYDRAILLRPPYSDHALVKAQFQVGEDPDARPFCIASYNMSNQCSNDNRPYRDASGNIVQGQFVEINPKTGRHYFANNPYNIRENDEQYQERLKLQLQYLQQQIDDGVDFINLQEVNGLAWRDAEKSHKRHPLFTEFLQKNNFDCVVSSENVEVDENNRVKNVITLFKKSRFTFEDSGVDLPSPAVDGVVTNHGMFCVFIDQLNGRKIMIGNVHGDYSHDATPQIHRLQTETSKQNIACITCGDMNRPAAYVNGAFTNGFATCHDNPDKEMVDGLTSAGGNNYKKQSIFHGETPDKRAAEVLKTYDYFIPQAPADQCLLAQILPHQTIEQKGDDVEFVDSAESLVYKIDAGKSFSNQPERAADYEAPPPPEPPLPPPPPPPIEPPLPPIPPIAPLAPTATVAAATATKLATSQKLIAALANHIKNNEPLDQALTDCYEDSLTSQQKKFTPTKAYRGIGAEVEVKIMKNGKIGLEIKEVFGKDLARFKDKNGQYLNEAATINNLENSFISSFNVGGQDVDINDLAVTNGGMNNPNFLEKIAAHFHQQGNITITIADKNGNPRATFVCERNEKTVFVTKNCAQSGGTNAVYDPHTAGLEALQDCDKICNAADAIFAPKVAAAAPNA